MQKKLLVFVPEFPVITETFIARELSALVELGQFEVQIVAMRRGTAPIPENLKSKIYFHRVTFWDYLRGKLHSFKHPIRRFRAFKAVGFTRPFLFIKTLGYANVFSKFQPDLIYAHFLSIPSTIALGAAILLDVPLGISGHARDVFEYPDRVDQKIKSAKFISICNKNAFGKLKGQNVKLIYHGINPGEIEVGAGVKRAEPPMILSIGRYVEKKGMEYLIRAAKALKDSGREFSLVIIGGGPLEPRLKSLTESLGLQNEVVLAGEQSFEDVRKTMHLASVYAQPSIDASGGDSDGVPNTLIEVALAGVPIVTTDAGGIRDFLSEENAILVPQKNPEKIAEGIIELLENENKAKELSANAKSRALEMFNTEKNIGELAGLISGAMK